MKRFADPSFSSDVSPGRMSCCTRWLALAIILTAATKAVSAPADDLPARLAAINEKASHITDLKADFVQEKQSPLLKNPLISRGTVFSKGANSLWQTTSPEPSTMTSDPHFLRLYFPDRKVVEEYPIRSQLGMLAASPLPSLDAIKKSFTISADSGNGLVKAGTKDVLALILKPSTPELQQYVDHVRVLLDTERGVVDAFEMTDPDGEVTLICFSNIQTDIHLPDDAVKLQLPPDVKTVRPLGDSAAANP